MDAVPVEVVGCLREPAFEAAIVTFCIWRRYGDPAWQLVPVEFPPADPDPDGSAQAAHA